jgi:hypothetical protein
MRTHIQSEEYVCSQTTGSSAPATLPAEHVFCGKKNEKKQYEEYVCSQTTRSSQLPQLFLRSITLPEEYEDAYAVA